MAGEDFDIMDEGVGEINPNNVSSVTSKLTQVELKARKQILAHKRLANDQAGTISAFRVAIDQLNKLMVQIGQSSRNMAVSTARFTRDSMRDFRQTMSQEFNVNKPNLVGMSISKVMGPIVGFVAAKFVESGVVQNALNKVKQKMGDTFENLKERYKERKENKRRNIERLIEEGNKGKVPRLAAGGIIKRDTFARVHSGEAVVPVNKLIAPLEKIANSFSGSVKEKKKGMFGDIGASVTGSYKGSIFQKMLANLQDIRTGIVGQMGTFRIVLHKMYIENPIFRNAIRAIRLVNFAFTAHKKLIGWLYRPRGGYIKDLPKKGSPPEQTAAILGLMYTGFMTKYDQILFYLKTMSGGAKAPKAKGLKDSIYNRIKKAKEVEGLMNKFKVMSGSKSNVKEDINKLQKTMFSVFSGFIPKLTKDHIDKTISKRFNINKSVREKLNVTVPKNLIKEKLKLPSRFDLVSNLRKMDTSLKEKRNKRIEERNLLKEQKRIEKSKKREETINAIKTGTIISLLKKRKEEKNSKGILNKTAGGVKSWFEEKARKREVEKRQKQVSESLINESNLYRKQMETRFKREEIERKFKSFIRGEYFRDWKNRTKIWWNNRSKTGDRKTLAQKIKSIWENKKFKKKQISLLERAANGIESIRNDTKKGFIKKLFSYIMLAGGLLIRGIAKIFTTGIWKSITVLLPMLIKGFLFKYKLILSVGKKILGIIPSFLKFARPAIAFLSKLFLRFAGGAAGAALLGIDAFKGTKKSKEWGVSKSMAGIAGALGGTKGSFTSAGALAGVAKGAAIGTLFGPGVGTAIGALIGGLLGFIGGEKIAKGMDWLWRKIGRVVSFITKVITWPIKALWIIGKKFISNISLVFGGVLKNLWKVTKDISSIIWTILKLPFKALWFVVKDLTSNIWKMVSSIFKGDVDKLSESILDLIGFPFRMIFKLGDVVISKVKSLWKDKNPVITSINKIWRILTFIPITITSIVSGIVKWIMESAVDLLPSSIGNRIKNTSVFKDSISFLESLAKGSFATEIIHPTLTSNDVANMETTKSLTIAKAQVGETAKQNQSAAAAIKETNEKLAGAIVNSTIIINNFLANVSSTVSSSMGGGGGGGFERHRDEGTLDVASGKIK